MADFTIPYLESLSTGELIDLADKCGLDIPLGLERVFIIEELLYLDEGNAGQADEQESDNTLIAGRDFTELAALPKQYHISFIDVLVRDPLWAFVFWEIKVYDRELYEQTADFEGYCLRVMPLAEDGHQPNMADSFTVAVSADDSARYLGFPPDEASGWPARRCFKIELCALHCGNYTVLAVSRSFTLPRIIEPKLYMRSVYQNPLAQLSGVDRFSLVRSADRASSPRGI
ncbi:MAG: DUF4912 domain-containing protein [Treponema sp.]|nr:DUF4912 domain-containing protein [Treponema sp.]